MQEMTPAQYAKHAGKSREGVRKMMVTGRIPWRQEGAQKWIDPAAADRARGKNIARLAIEDDATDDVAPVAAGAPVAEKPGLTAARTEREQYMARLAELELNERLGKLRPVEDFTIAAQRCAETAIRAIERISGRADELVALVTKEGVHGARTALRAISRDLRNVLAAEFSKLASGELAKDIERDDEQAE